MAPTSLVPLLFSFVCNLVISFRIEFHSKFFVYVTVRILIIAIAIFVVFEGIKAIMRSFIHCFFVVFIQEYSPPGN